MKLPQQYLLTAINFPLQKEKRKDNYLKILNKHRVKFKTYFKVSSIWMKVKQAVISCKY